MGSAIRPDGVSLTLDADSLLLNGQRWTPVMGEFHYARLPADEWREEMLRLKAGGIDVVATYVFWIHHEEIEGQFDWTERRNLRRFVRLCGDVGLKVIVRCGPWCHGEVRNGGQPDWLLKKGWKLRSNDPQYLEKARILYREIAGQLKGLLWKDGGPVIGIQLENEYRGPAEHLLTLKTIAREVGLDVPLYTRTGWPALSSPMPFGEIVPLYGAYAEGFWDRELVAMPGRYWAGFHFSKLRTDANIANEVLGRANVKDAGDVVQYPYLTCEIGAGMMTSYHRRIRADPADAEVITLVKLGSGSTSPGYYMYHGGVNPEGKLTTLQESQATGYWNDLPEKSYDFQTALGEYNQIRPQYHLLRRLHLFLHDWGDSFAGMRMALPDQRPTGRDDTNTLRWCVRSDGRSGFVFVNNFERLRHLPPKPDVQFTVKLPEDTLTFPNKPITVPAGSRFFWPFNFDLGHGVTLAWATAQPLCAVEDENVRTVFFVETKGVPAIFAFANRNLVVSNPNATIVNDKGVTLLGEVEAGASSVTRVQFAGATNEPPLQLMLLDEVESLALWKGSLCGRERVFLTKAGLILDDDELRLASANPDELNIKIFPAPKELLCNGVSLPGARDGIFQRYTPFLTNSDSFKPVLEVLQSAGPARDIPMGTGRTPVATAPEDSDFEQAAVWRIKIPAELDPNLDPLLRINYVGDVARVVLNGKLLTDNFYNGNSFEVGLRRHAPEILSGELHLKILPLREDAPIYLPLEARPEFGSDGTALELQSVEIVPHYQVELRGE